MHFNYVTKRVLIWGKTYPELSERYDETVCTAGCTEDGRPIRIYPVRLRYLEKHQQYSLYDWIEVPMVASTKDRRPESFRVDGDKLRVVDHLDTKRGWLERRKVILGWPGWRYDCVRDLEAAQRQNKTSIGLVKVGAVEKVTLELKTNEERRQFEEKAARIKSRLDLFSSAKRDLDFYPYRIYVHWFCTRLTGPNCCPGHNNLILDWGLGELGRREGGEKARDKMESIADLDRHDLQFYMGNFKAHPHRFGVVGLWYPLRRDVDANPFAQEELFG